VLPAFGVILVATGCRNDLHETPPAPPAAASSGEVAGPPPDAAAAQASGSAACAPLDPARLAPFAACAATVVKTPVPDIVDEPGTLAPLYERLAELERALATRPLRIGMYGDSNLTSDFLSGHLRRVLQARYGDAGHGWISWSRPWGSYRHEDVTVAGYWPMFKQYAPTTNVGPDKHYGFANMAAESNEIGAAAWAGTTKDPKATVGKTVTHFELHYLKHPRGGSFRIDVDRAAVRTVETRAPAVAVGFEEVDVEEGPHEIRGVVRGDGPVRFFGVSLDRSTERTDPLRAGVQVDSLGAGALNFERLNWVANDTRAAGLARRAYDVVVFWLGTNVMFVPPNREYALETLRSFKAALPGVPILLLSPADTAKDGDEKSEPRIVAVIKQLREVAAEASVAFWDFREAMGGDGAIQKFTKRGLAGDDHIHFGPEGSRLMGDRLLCALGSAFRAYVASHADAGCRRKPAEAVTSSRAP
jgi:hypothetical protein